MARDFYFSQKQLLNVIELQTQIIKLGTDVHAIMKLLVEDIQNLTNATASALTLLEDDYIVCHAVSKNVQSYIGKRFHLNDGLAGYAIKNKKLIYSMDYQGDDRVNINIRKTMSFESIVVLPLFFQEQAVGVYLLFSNQKDAFSKQDLQLLNLLSDTISAALYQSIKLEKQIKLASMDYLTGLNTRAILSEYFEKNNHQHAGLLMIDMNDLKFINDHYGHRAGDLALIEVGKRLKRQIRKDDLIVRLGGDEFAVFLANIHTADAIQLLINRFIQVCSEAFYYKNQAINISISVGYALYPKDGKQLTTLMEVADQHMYNNKRHRKHSKNLIQE
ncbi:GGDEF domain-containing protein [Acinetobacter qingfengensis]|uniref:GGDEF domain-containing protein n=1 Tax=Acinetobacter qingfengensis TaxID=1262585 RepID=A0A1E7RDG9_9GAMM|nr:sensor domain-containing diguanylate cyclase [Acinetobacter qingfengensis]KAA8735332.1 GGDEF domain-containing protein [Acinetobacter qingfengensis]OEY97450.1 hypothetical protein BJI46_10125 [Acinetobacter qingfengensis]